MSLVSVKAAIVGARAFTAGEIMRIAVRHPWMEIGALQARVEAPEPIEKTFPALRGRDLPPVRAIDPEALPDDVSAVFLCLPHTVSAKHAGAILERGIRVFDLSADFRFSDHRAYEQTYGLDHPAPELNRKAVYGLPELHRAHLSAARLVACPGCYPTSVILALAPLMKRDMIDAETIIADCKSGVSGAGREPNDRTHYCHANESVEPYKVADHRHQPEIEEQLSRLAGDKRTLTFVPHLMPMDRGIISTIYARLSEPMTDEAIHALFTQFYRNDPFVRVLPVGTYPTTKAVSGTNFCDIAVKVDAKARRLILMSAIDNLLKGASGQAVQCFNISFGMMETDGLM